MQRDREKVLLPCIFLKLVSPQQKQLPADSLGLSLNLFSLEKSEVSDSQHLYSWWLSVQLLWSEHAFFLQRP